MIWLGLYNVKLSITSKVGVMPHRGVIVQYLLLRVHRVHLVGGARSDCTMSSERDYPPVKLYYENICERMLQTAVDVKLVLTLSFVYIHAYIILS